MKKIFAILSVAATALMMVVSCEKEEAPHQPGEPDVANCYGVFFPVQEATGYHIYDPSQDLNATFTVGRKNSQGNITVPVVVEASADNVFEIATISFADGQTETTFNVNMKNVEDGKQYDLHLEVTDPQYASLYGSNTTFMDFSFMRVKMEYFLNPKTKEKAKVTFSQGAWNEVHTGYIKYYEVNGIRYCSTEGEELVGAGSKDGGFWGQDPDVHLEFVWYQGGKESCDCDEGSHPSLLPDGIDGVPGGAQMIRVLPKGIVDYGGSYQFYPYDYFSYYQDKNAYARGFLHFINANELFDSVSYYDGNGGFFFWIYGYTSEASGWVGDWAQGYDIVGIAEGFSRVDYSLELESDYPYDGETPIYIEAGLDVENLKYAIYEGELSKIQIENKVAAIIDGSEASTEFSDFEIDEDEEVKYATLAVSPDETGLYTLVAVAFDKDKTAQNSAGVYFTFVSAEDQEEYEVVVEVFTEDTPDRYTSYHDYDSFAFGVSGKDLTEVHLAVVSDGTIAQAGLETILYDLKVDSKGDYTVDDDVLDQINGEGGYYTVMSGMDAKTTYYVLVWATNGSMEEYAFDVYTTEPMPYVWNKVNDGVLIDGAMAPIFGEDPQTYECEVFEEASIPGFYMVSGYQCALAEWWYGQDMSEYTSYWKNEFYIHAEDPEKVYVEEQPFGVYTSSYGWVSLVSVEEMFGTLENNVITFPAGSLYINLAGYYPIPILADLIISFNGSEPNSVKINNPQVLFNKTDKVMNANFLPVDSFERDPQPVKVSVKVNYTRKEKSNDNKVLSVSNKTIDVR